MFSPDVSSHMDNTEDLDNVHDLFDPANKMMRQMGAKSEVASRRQIETDFRAKSRKKVRKYKNTAKALEKQMRES